MATSHSTGRPASYPPPDPVPVLRELLLLRRQAPVISANRAVEIGKEIVPAKHVLHARMALLLLAEPGPALVQACRGDRAVAVTLAEAAGGVEQAAKYLVALGETLSLSAERIVTALTVRPDASEVAQEARATIQGEASHG